MVLLSDAQEHSGLVAKLNGVLATSGEYAVDEICGDERRVHRCRVCNWSNYGRRPRLGGRRSTVSEELGIMNKPKMSCRSMPVSTHALLRDGLVSSGSNRRANCEYQSGGGKRVRVTRTQSREVCSHRLGKRGPLVRVVGMSLASL